MSHVEDNPEILVPIQKNTELKSMIVKYVGDKLKPENDEVNVEMVIQVMAEEFPELLLALAEENFVRGYQQAASDIKDFEITYNKTEEK